MARGDALRDRLPATILSLEEAGHSEDAKFLGALSFARFRLREVPVDPALEDDPAVKRVQRVAREDRITRLSGLANFVASVLEREAIVTELGARGMDRDTLIQLHADADASVRAGQNLRMAAEATQREHAAVRAQKAKWNALRRMIRKAVAGDDSLEKLFSQC